MPSRGSTALIMLLASLLALPACTSQPENSATGTADSVSKAAIVSVSPGDWPGYNRTLAGERYSPLKDIDRSNVSGLQQLCAYALPEVTSLQTGPIVIGGVMYFTTDTISYAIDAATCAEKWKQVRHSETPGALAVNRGFAYMDGRLFRGTSDARVLAMDTTDGHTLWEHVIDEKAPGVSIPMAPIAVNGLVYVGHAGGDQVGVTGHVYALDAVDGHVVWKFEVVPNTPEVQATWTNKSLPISGGGFWTSFTFDEPNNVLYVPAGNPAPDFDIERRTGDNLYTNSVIALDGTTGRMLGYNQLVKRDAHDWDVDSPIALVTTRSGRAIAASANKDGLLSVLDRSKITRDTTRDIDLSAQLPIVYQVPTTTRNNVDVPLSRTRKVRFCPGITGGSEWNGAAFSPDLNTLYVGAVDWCATVLVEPADRPVPALGATWLAAANTDMFGPASEAKGWLTAYDAESGGVRWKFAAPHPMLAGVTPTAGGLVFAADMGGELYAFSADSGAVLWRTNTGQSSGGGIVTYTAGGRQLLGVASGMKSPVWPGGADKSRILVYGLK